jgi:uncharacterized protein (DUF58 family)
MKLLYRIYRLYSGMRYRLGRRFTRTGLAIAGGACITAAMGPDTEHNLAYQAFAILSGLLLIAFLWSFSFRARFKAERLLPRFATVGTPFEYTVRVSNLSRKTQAGLVVLDDLEDTRPDYKQWRALQIAENRHSFRLNRPEHPRTFRGANVEEGVLPPVQAGAVGEARMVATPMRRGLLTFKSVTICRSDPLGLFRAFRRVPLPQTVLVLPHRYPLPTIALPGSMKYQDGGVALAAHIGQSEEFVSLRDYRHGDPLRHIHWRSWARTGKPVVKEFEDEFFVRHALVLDTFTRLPFSHSFEEAVSIAASFACTLDTHESLLDLLFVGTETYCFTAGRGLAHTDQMLAILASVVPCLDKQFSSLEHLVINHVQSVSGCICVLLDWDEARQEFVRKLKKLGIPVLVLVVKPTQGKTLDPGPMREDADRFHILEPGAVGPVLARLE